MVRATGWAAAAAAVALALAGCAAADGAESGAASTPPASPTTAATSSTAAPSPVTPSAAESTQPTAEAAQEPRRSRLSIPALGVRDVAVVRYRGRPDDGPGTRIQNRGPAASPRGSGGGVGPGEVGNFIVTGHRTSHDAPFRDLPELREGEHVLVRSGDTVFDYVVTGTRQVSFRSERSMARQTAAVPGRPGEPAVEPMITLSTCATPEDHAAGNYWADRFGNPEHRIDKIGVLTDVRPAG
jgi:sortase A